MSTDPTPTPDTLQAAAQAVVDAWLKTGGTGFMTSRMDALRAALAASPAPTDTPDEPECECAGTESSQGHCPAHGYDEFRPAAVTAAHEDERQVCREPHGLRWAPPHTHAEPAAAPAAERATPDPDTLAARLVEITGYGNVAFWHDKARALIAAGVTLNETTTNQLTPDAAVRTLAGQLLDLIAGLVVNSPDELIDFCNDAARHLVSTGVTLNETATTPTQEDAK